MKEALVIIDIQNDYFEDGRYPLCNTEKTAEKAQLVLQQFRTKGLPIMHIQHVNPQGAPFFEIGTSGVEIHNLMRPLPNETVVIKHYPNSFKDTTLKSELDKLGIDKLVIIGMMTHMCIDTTTRAAKDLGYECTLLADCCTTRDLEYVNKNIDAPSVQLAYLAALNGYFAKVIDSSELSL